MAEGLYIGGQIKRFTLSTSEPATEDYKDLVDGGWSADVGCGLGRQSPRSAIGTLVLRLCMVGARCAQNLMIEAGWIIGKRRVGGSVPNWRCGQI